MADLAKLVVSLEANQSKLIRGLDDTNKRIRAFQQRTDSSLKKVDKAFAGASRGVNLLKGALVALGAQRIISGIANINDAYASIEGRIKLVTGSTEEATKVQEELFAIAQKTGTEFQATAELYTRLARSSKSLGATQQELIQFTEGVGAALRIGGRTATQASGALLQLSQALASGTVRSEEFNSIIEGAPTILQAMADGIEGVNGDIGKLQQLVKSGELSSQEAFKGLLSQVEKLKAEASLLPPLISQSVTKLSDAFKKAIAQADVSSISEGLDEIARIVTDPATIAGISSLASAIAGLVGWLLKAAAAAGNFGSKLGEVLRIGRPRVVELREEIELLTAAIRSNDKFLGGLGNNARLAQRDRLQAELNVLTSTGGAFKSVLADLNADIAAIKPPPNKGIISSLLGPPEVDKARVDALKAAASETQNALESLRNLEAGLRQEFESAGLEGAALLQYRLSVGDLSDELKKAGSAGREAAEGALAYQRAIDESAKIEEHRIQLLEEESKQMEEIKSLYERHREAITGVDSTTQAFKDTIFDLNRLLAAGRINYDQYTQAVFRTQDAFDEARKSSEENANQVTKFAESAAQGIQQAFADFFFDPFDQGLKGLLDNLQRTLDRAAAEILASQLSGFLFGNQAGSTSSGFGGGFLGKIGGAIAGVFGGGGSTAVASDFGHVQGFAHGGRYSANEPRIVGEFGPELDIPDHSGRIIPNNQLGGGMNVTINQSVTVADGGTLSPRSRHQIANETAIGVQRALARHNGR